MGDSPDTAGCWSESNKGLNKEALEFINGQILSLNPRPDMVFFLGDLVTRTHNAAGHRFIPDWKEVMKPLSLEGIKIYVAVGNRDLYGNTGWTEKPLEAEFQQYFSDPPHFDMPDNGLLRA